MFDSRRFRHAHTQACRAYVAHAYRDSVLTSEDLDAIVARMVEREALIGLTSGVVAAVVDGSVGDEPIRAGCRVYVGCDEIGDALMIHNECDGGSSIRCAAQAAEEAWRTWF